MRARPVSVFALGCAVTSTCALGCERAASSEESSGPSDGGTSTGSTSTGGGTTFGEAVPCSASEPCCEGVCVAPYDPGAGSGIAGMGAPVCVPSCVPEDALELWCIDDASCCDGLECSATDGFCVGTGDSSESTAMATVGETWVVDSSSEGDGTSTQSSDSSAGSETGTDTSTGTSTG